MKHSESLPTERSAVRLGMCDCARTREFCLTKGCKQGTTRAHWTYTTEGRDKDHLRRIVYQRDGKPVSRWLRPERAVAEAWLMNMQPHRSGIIFIEKLGPFAIETGGVR
jgi:hypothetical protein